MFFERCLLSLLALIFLLSCNDPVNKGATEKKLFRLVDSKHTGINFSNTLYPTAQLNVITFEYFYNGAGVALGDINNDGLVDIYFSGNMVSGKLYLNKGDFKFEDITKSSGVNTLGKWGTGVSMVDINADGFLDLYLCFSGPYGPEERKNMLYINNGNLTFTESAASYGLDDDSHSTQATFLDFDRDGDLDLYLLNNITDRTGPNIIRPKRNKGEMLNTDKLYRNDGGLFTDISESAGILKEGYGLGVAIGDVDQDGWPDIYVSNDYLSNDLLYRNNGNGTFTDIADEYLRHTSYSSMGCDMADFNNDGLLDIIAVDMLPPNQERRAVMMGSLNHERFQSELKYGYQPQFMRNSLQLNQGSFQDQRIPFSEIGHYAGLESTDWSWSPLFADIDNDGLKDVLVTNGYPRDITNLDFASYKANRILGSTGYSSDMLVELAKELEKISGAYIPNAAFKNQGSLDFEDVSKSWGFVQNSFSHGAAVADLDNDGDLDYVVNNSYDNAFIYENTLKKNQENNFLRIKLISNTKNRDGWGSKVTLYQEGKRQYQELNPIRGYQSSIEPLLHFGLGSKKPDSLCIEWPDGKLQWLRSPAADQTLVIRYDPKEKKPAPPHEVTVPLFTNIDLVAHDHAESNFSDFANMPILPKGYSQNGPALCAGDVNGDGLDDFFIGGASGHPGKIFIQDSDGHFSARVLNTDILSENVAAIFFDADGDGDLDLYVANGSSEHSSTPNLFQDRLYLNNGFGHFQDFSQLLPQMKTNTTTVSAIDYDQDGDIDLFVGGGVNPMDYTASKSYLLENIKGQFIDITVKLAPELRNFGIITDSHWEDMDKDGYPELWLSGEWMPLTLFKNEKGYLRNITDEVGLANTVGWWNKIAFADLDKDGDLDIVAGNLGLNSPYRSSKERPFSLHLADFDGNEYPVISHYLKGKKVPLNFRDDLLEWIQPLKNKFRDYSSFANAEWAQIVPDEKLSRTLNINTFKSAWIENVNGVYTLHPLPTLAQLAPINGILIADFNQDGNEDILLSGNSKDQNPFVGYLDAFNGLLLLGDSRGNFTAQAVEESGFLVNGNGMDMALIKGIKGARCLLVSQNNGPLLSFSILKK